MALSRRMTASALLLLFLLVATEMGTTTTTKLAEARDCLSQSHKFKGACLSSSNCAAVCRTESFPEGDCHTPHFARKCFCKRPC
ncbi:defensin-like protein CAL1 [Triticum dicoccoides]|uniref:defensin-like protein CAL1 n=1 Tax=Triticum dicoccoides TaxID=85692 RepID=UPI000E7C745C|nr:defensin-like protein CAL1 [Triticum dicoccoides]